MKPAIDWQHFEACVRAARAVGCDEDQARDVALATLEELAAAAAPKPISQIRRRARWRAADKLRAARRQVAQSTGFNVDSFPSDCATPEQLHALDRAVGSLPPRAAAVLAAQVGGETDARIARDLGVTQNAVQQISARTRRRLLDAF